MLTIGSLFSGIGGLERGLEMAGLGPVLWQVEKDEFCRRVLAKHWPGVDRYEDVRSVRASQLRSVDIVCGGFPCQDVSSAGKRKGLSGERSGLWWEFARIVKDARPRFVVVENVASGAKKWLCQVRTHLHQLGYRTRALGIAASDVGASHQRKRIFVIAHTDAGREHVLAEHAEVAKTSSPSWAGGLFSEPDMVRVANGLRTRLDSARRRALGNAVVPQCAQVAGEVIRLILEAA